MAESDVTTARHGGDEIPPGKPMTAGQHILDKGAQMMQSLKPIKQMNQHACTFAIYSHDMARQIETHHYVSRLNEDLLQCAVYDSDEPAGRLIGDTDAVFLPTVLKVLDEMPRSSDFLLVGVEYIISDKLFETLPLEEQRLWHSHAYEIKSGLWVNPRIPEMILTQELKNLAKTYGKFWCTWQTDRGDKLPMGPPALMVSPQAADGGMVRPELVLNRDNKYNISCDALKRSRLELPEPEWLNPQADYWKQHGKGFAVDVKTVELKKTAPFP